MGGKIIVVTGGPRTGKSTLVRLLSEQLNATPFYEGEEKDFPQRIVENMTSGKRMLELILWFRNKGVDEYVEALKLKAAGKTVCLDTFYLTNEIYINEWVKDNFEKYVLKRMMAIDSGLLPWPDLVISLSSDAETIRKFVELGGRSFEDELYLEKQIKLNEAHEEYFRDLKRNKILFADRKSFDFFKPQDFSKLVSEVTSRLN